MASMSYEEIFSDFLGSVTDYQIASLDTSEAYQLMTEYLHKSISKSYIRRLFATISLDDEIQTVSFELSNVVDDSSDFDFIKNILSKCMVIEWLEPQVRSKNNIAQMFAGKEAKFYSQKEHLSELRSLLEDVRLDVRKMIRDRDYIYNPYLGG